MNKSSDLASIIVQQFNYYSSSIPAYNIEVNEFGEGDENKEIIYRVLTKKERSKRTYNILKGEIDEGEKRRIL